MRPCRLEGGGDGAAAAATHAPAEFLPPTPELVQELLADLCTYLDGNGHTGRALVHVVLRRRGLAPRYVPPSAWCSPLAPATPSAG